MEYFTEFLNNKIHFRYVSSAYLLTLIAILLLFFFSIVRTKKFEKEHKRFENKNEGQT